ncbi:MAG: hypothetical protein ACI389_03255 [Methanobrevibacter sp.]|uniref:hypothetical protein n=1 Tax=Methanobrevibacter sp. TaxID=66852 RepID=UPI003EFBFF8B
MKVKNSHILLIISAIILLISLGTVSANDVSTDSISDNGTNVDSGNDVVIPKIDTEIVSNDVKIKDTETVTINATVKDNNSNPIPGITNKNLTVIEGNKSINFNYNESKITILDDLSIGNHNLTINYLGNEIYSNSTTNILLSIFGNYTLETPSSINVNSSKIVEIPINVTNGVDIKDITADDFNIILTYKDGNETKILNISDLILENNKLIFTYTLSNNITSSDMTIIYNGNKEKTINLNRIYKSKIEVINSKNQYQNGNFTFKVIDIDTNEVLSGVEINFPLLIGGNHITVVKKTNEQGIASFKTSELSNWYETFNDKLNVGNYTIELSTNGIYKSTPFKVNLTIEQAQINIKIDPFKDVFGTKKNVTITVTNSKNGEPVPGIILHLYMPDTSKKDYYYMTDANGQCKISVSKLVGGTYSITASNNDTENMIYTNDSGKITITPQSIKMTITSGLTIYYNTGYTAIIKVTDKTGKGVSGVYLLVQLYTGSKASTYIVQTDKNGIAKFSVPLNVGKHKMIVSKSDKRYTEGSTTKYITVKKATAKISAPQTKAYYKQGKYFVIKLVNTKKSNAPIYGAKLNIRVYISSYRYYNYNGNTSGDGTLKLLIDLKPGTYKVEVRGADSKNFAASKVSSKIVVYKTPTKVTPTKLTAKKGQTTYFKVTVQNTKTKKVIPGVQVKIKVYTGKTYKTYTVKTNSKGVAQLNVKSLSLGTHKVIVSSANSYCVAKSATSYITIKK